MASLVSFLTSLLLAYRKYSVLSVLCLYPATLLKIFIKSDR